MGGSWELLKDKFLVGAGDAYTLGASGGEAEHTLTVNEMPRHTHANAIYNQGSGTSAANHVTWGTAGTVTMTIAETGGSQAHNNLPPYTAVNMWLRTA